MDLSRPFRRLTDDDCRRLHEASCRILERTGVRLHHPPAVRLLEASGARVSEENRVRIPQAPVERALETVPSTVMLYDRGGAPAVEAGGLDRPFNSRSADSAPHRTRDGSPA